MRFITFGYLIFFSFIFILYWLLPRKQNKLMLIAIASSIFYASWSIPFFIHFISLVILNYFFSLKIKNNNNNNRKYFLIIILLINILNLVIFKYFYLILQFLYDITGFYFFEKTYFNTLLLEYFNQESIILPLAISFYTFQLMAYIIDCYNQKITRNDNFLEFYVFILFFPQLVAGPIMRHSDFFYQLDNEISLNHEKVIKGFYHIFTGLIKKVIIADNISQIIQPVFLNPLEYSGLTNFLAAVGYAIRVYGDFSGYTDIARGSAYLLGFHIPENFDGPFLSISITELWRRWHVTLSSWLRDYIYIPLGGNRISEFRTSLNLIITFTIGGLWHGANYTFILWGFMYGVLLVLEKPFIKNINSIIQRNLFYRIFGIFYTFIMFSIGLCFFNAPDIQHSFYMLKQIFLFHDGSDFNKDQIIQMTGFLLLVFFFNYIQYKKKDFNIKIKRDYIILYFLGILEVWLLGNYAPQVQGFIYFQF
ncbi:MAG: membrane-bound O-acyltransferase family protein [Leptospiraceae bacterium]|nr:MAG: membrane-bound O-acyltransferase family protein [Leptospiraceae bacterium]